MGIFRRNKKKEEWKIEISDGVFLGRPVSRNHQKPFMSCVPKGIMVFLVVFGSLGGFISAFNVECNYVIPGIVLFLCAMYFSGLFAFKKSRYKDIGYIIYFIFFVIGIYMLKSYVNSGFAAIVNMVRQRGELYFDLTTGTEFAENIDDRYLTVTITFIFIGMFEIILLNIFVSNYMSLKLAVFMALPLYVIPLYFQVEANLFFVLCMFAGFTGIHIYKNNGHFREGKGRFDYEREKKKKIPELSYSQDNRVYAGVMAAALLCVLLVGGFTLFFGNTDFQKYYSENKYKTATREGVSGFIMIGFRSFFPNLYSRGGMSGGYLGNIAAVRPDEQTDLIVRFTPYNTDPVYLKGYTGIQYMRNQWLDGYKLMGSRMGHSTYFYTESMANEAEQLSEAFQKRIEGSSRGIMEITNKGADVSYIYYPYFTRFDDYSTYVENPAPFFVGIGLGDTERFTYYPNIGDEALRPGTDIQDMQSYVYTSVPEENQEAIDGFLQEAGISKGDPDAVQKVVDYMERAYSYSYNPGRVPAGEDFVDYFLSENKKGVCTHFASAATLIFRRLGIPARYVEGYAFGYGKVLEGKVCEDLNYDDYYSGYSELGKTAVMEVELTDANAHAWVEIYEEGKGWLVVDPTPAATAVEEGSSSSGNFWNSIRDFWENSPDMNIEGDISGVNMGFLDSDGIRFLGYMALLLLVLAVGIRFCVIRIFRWRKWHTKDLRKNMLYYYGSVCRKRARRDEIFARMSMPSDQVLYLASRYEEKTKKTVDVEHIVHCLEEICFGPAEPGREEYDHVMGMLKKIR